MSIQKSVEEYISGSNNIRDCLKKNLVNYSALTRKISKELNFKAKDFDAVLVACRRYGEKIRKKTGYERPIKKLLKNSKLEIKNKVAVAVVEKTIFFNNLADLQKEVKRMKKDTKFEVILSVIPINSVFSLSSRVHDMTRMI